MILQVFTFSQKISVNFQLLLRFIQGVSLLLALAGLVIAIAFTDLSVTDVLASILAFVPTGWGILCVSSLQLKFLFFLCIFHSLRPSYLSIDKKNVLHKILLRISD